MKILVCISKTPDTTAKISFKNNNSQYDDAGVQFIVNPYDEWYALGKALELKEQNADNTVHILSVGLADAEAIMRKAFALGGDEGFRINTESSDSYFIAAQIADFAQKNGYDVVLVGKETIDHNSGAVGGMLAACLDMPYVALATKIDVEGNTFTVSREIEGGEEILQVQAPVVISCQKGVSEQRIPNMKGIMGARTKKLTVVEPIAVEALTTVTQFELPPAKQGVKLISADEVETLVNLLHTEAKVI